jgi:ABC-type lipoprotein release transport system permease subunit
MLFIWKHISIGILGGSLGLILGAFFVALLAHYGQGIPFEAFGSFAIWLEMAALAVIGASLLALIAGWIPAVIASRQDPAEVLREE